MIFQFTVATHLFLKLLNIALILKFTVCNGRLNQDALYNLNCKKLEPATTLFFLATFDFLLHIILVYDSIVG